MCQEVNSDKTQATIWIQELALEPFGLKSLETKTFELGRKEGFAVDDFLNLLAITTKEGSYLAVTKRYINSEAPEGSANDWLILYKWTEEN